ncbi:MAG: hypothetical protein ACD_22C00253G0002 [uncultured bacterium]|nr:MAG: hypothetical protein ACD_22C00253G0002 [uncultured bacterium]
MNSKLLTLIILVLLVLLGAIGVVAYGAGYISFGKPNASTEELKDTNDVVDSDTTKDTVKTDTETAVVIDKEKDAALIKQALINKGLNMTGTKVTISKDTGEYASGGVTAIDPDEVAGGGYVFAAKVNGVWEIVADGNGTISCAQLEPYPNFPVGWIPECVDENFDIVYR